MEEQSTTTMFPLVNIVSIGEYFHVEIVNWPRSFLLPAYSVTLMLHHQMHRGLQDPLVFTLPYMQCLISKTQLSLTLNDVNGCGPFQHSSYTTSTNK